jgi:hypothetical protein
LNIGCCISWYAIYSATKLQGAKVAATRILPKGSWVLGAAEAARLYRHSVKRRYWVLVYILIELLIYYTMYILKLAG